VAIQTTLATRYWLKTIIMIVVCVVLGVWGIWDYVVAIPQAQIGAERAALLNDVVQPAMETEIGSEERVAASVLLSVNTDSLDVETNSEWITAVGVFKKALVGNTVSIVEYETFLQEELGKYGNVTPPSKYDLPMQWLFIACLPFGLYYFLVYVKMKMNAARFRLDDDGALSTPEGSWGADEIQGIDMSRWISKTGKARSTWTAKAIVGDGTPVLLDDYIYKDMHLIIGALAHRFYPEEWTPLARRVKVETVESEEETVKQVGSPETESTSEEE
jgi:hypothetical protein